MSVTFPSRLRLMLLAACGVLSLAGGPVATSWSQPKAAAPKYQEIPVAQNLAGARNRVRGIVQRKAMEVLRNKVTELTPEREKLIKDWYNGVEFREMSHVSKLNAAPDGAWESLPERRRRFFDDLRNAGVRGNQEAHDYLVQLTVKAMLAFSSAERNYHPAVRYNAMLILGDLNKLEAILGGAGRRPDLPLYEVLTTKGGLIETITNTKQLPAVRVAAMIGVVRHVKGHVKNVAPNKIKPDDLKKLLQALVGLARQKAPEPGMTPDGQAWLRRQALEAFGELKMADAGNAPALRNAVSKMVASAIGEKDAPLFVRCAAADAFGRLQFTTIDGLNAKQIATDLGTLGIDVVEGELDAADKQKRSASAAMVAKRSLAVYGGLKGLGRIPRLTANDQSTVAAIAKAVEATAAIRGEGPALEDKLQTQLTALRAALGQEAGPGPGPGKASALPAGLPTSP